VKHAAGPAARAGKHVLVDKPMALDPADCVAMIDAAREAAVTLMVGPSHGYDAPVALAESLIANLIDNAIRHHLPGGQAEISDGPERPTTRTQSSQ